MLMAELTTAVQNGAGHVPSADVFGDFYRVPVQAKAPRRLNFALVGFAFNMM